MSHRVHRNPIVHFLIEPKVAKDAYERLAPRIHAIARDELAVVRADVQVAAIFAMTVAREIGEPALRARFVKLAQTGEHDAACSASLGDVALAAWHTGHRCLLAEATLPSSKIPVLLLDEAMALRARLLDRAEWQLLAAGDIEGAMLLLEPERSCRDIANNLLELAEIRARAGKGRSEDERIRLERDLLRARELGEELLARSSGASAEGPDTWSMQVRRAWTLLLRTYDEVRRAGLFLFPGREGEMRFPPLVGVTRAWSQPVGLAEMYHADHAAPAS